MIGSPVLEASCMKLPPLPTPPRPSRKEGPFALKVISGDLVYYDESDKVIMVSNWRTALGHYLDHCRKAGVEPIDITGFR